MQTPTPDSRRRLGALVSRGMNAFAFPLIIALILVLVLVYRQELTAVFATPQRVQDWVQNVGVFAPLAFIGVQIVQVIIFVIPGEVVQIAGGYLFGVTAGVLYSIIGITIGGTVNFFVARALGIPFVEALFSPSRLARFREVAESPRAKVGFFLFFLIPGIPKDILCYVAGIAPMSYPVFLGISVAGRLPALVGSNFIGDAAAAQQWHLALAILALSIVLFLLGIVFRGRLQAWIRRLSRNRPNKPTGSTGDESTGRFE